MAQFYTSDPELNAQTIEYFRNNPDSLNNPFEMFYPENQAYRDMLSSTMQPYGGATDWLAQAGFADPTAAAREAFAHTLNRTTPSDPRLQQFNQLAGQGAFKDRDFGDVLMELGPALPFALAIPAALGAGAGAGAAGAGGLSQAELAALIEAGTVGEAGAALEGLAGIGGAAGAGATLTTPDWLEPLLQETGEFGIDPAMLESGFNAAASNAPWFSALPTWAQNAVQGPMNPAGNGPANTAASGSAISRIIRGEGTLDDWLSVGGSALPGIIGAVGADRQADALEGLSREFMAMGAPSRARYESSFAPGFTMDNDPGYKDALDQSANAMLRRLSVKGNPGDSPTAWNQTLQNLYQTTAYPALQNYRQTNASAGGLADFTPAAINASGTEIAQRGRVFGELGGAVGDVTNPPSSLADIFRDFTRRRSGGGNSLV